mmetsp:Transcript_7499/g.19686  ORF Transcript_7499/g.19686 Transcript_7499/m.19686 type:complete len:129 (+) Transcript_7499:444-830(+)
MQQPSNAMLTHRWYDLAVCHSICHADFAEMALHLHHGTTVVWPYVGVGRLGMRSTRDTAAMLASDMTFGHTPVNLLSPVPAMSSVRRTARTGHGRSGGPRLHRLRRRSTRLLGGHECALLRSSMELAD